MKDEIIRKLQVFLRSSIEDEYKVVYLLTQIRKVFERDANLGPALPTLRFYCNWALHTKLEHRRTVQNFLAQVDPILTLQGDHDQATQDGFNRLFTLQAFRDELLKFLMSSDINCGLCDDDAEWMSFLSAYSCVVENCEIVVPRPHAPPHGPLNLSVQSISISPARAQGTQLAPSKPYPMDWAITYTDGRQGRLSLSEHGLLGAVVDIG